MPRRLRRGGGHPVFRDALVSLRARRPYLDRLVVEDHPDATIAYHQRDGI
ncbi:hypothetical protein [Halarchaeum salinum]